MYLTYSGSEMPETLAFILLLIAMQQHVKFKSKERFKKGVRVSLDIVPMGISKVIFQRRMAAVDGEFYLEKTIKCEKYFLLTFLEDQVTQTNEKYLARPRQRALSPCNASLSQRQKIRF